MPRELKPPFVVLVTAVISVVEAAVAAVVTAVSMVGSASQASVENLGVEIFWVVVALGVVWIAWQFVRARPWARTALITWHLLVFFSLVSLLRFLPVLTVLDQVGVVLGILGSAVAVALVFTPAARAYIVDTRAEILD